MIKILFILLFFCSFSYAGTIHPNKQDKDYCEYGKLYKHVVQLNCKKNSEKQIYSASAVIINPNWALTAAHVVKDMDIATIIKEKIEYNSNKIIWHDQFKEEVFGINDIALIRSEKNFDMEFYPELYEENDEVGQVAAICGYGITGDFNTGSIRYDGEKRAGTNKIERIENNILVCTASRTNITTLEFLIASGDSGGGLFINKKLAGINSIIFSDNGLKTRSIYDNCSGHTRVSKYIQWIKNKIKSENNNGR